MEHTRLRDLDLRLRILIGLLCFSCQMSGTHAEKILKLDPTSVVVLFGDPVSVNCSTNVTQHRGMGWEASQGSVPMKKNVQLITWSVEKLEEWDIQPMCFINVNHQNIERLKITVYKPPKRVFISTESHAEPMFEDNVYEIKCNVQHVAPIRLLTVNWYKEDQLINTEDFSGDNENFPVNKTTTLQIFPNRTDDGVQYTCEAELKLGPDGPDPIPKLTSDPFTITVHYGPEVSNCPDDVQIHEGQKLKDLCLITGNPFPDFSWEKDGLTIDPSIPLNRSASGLYTLIVNGDVRKMVNVMTGPAINCEKHYTVREGDSFNPNCTVEGYPSFEMAWHKDGDAVDFPITMQKRDAGQYLLISNNSHIPVHYAVEIEVLYPPSQILELQGAQVSVGEDVVLKCASNAKPRPKYYWIYNNISNVFTVDQDGVSLLHIINAGSENSGSYLCLASNDLGQVEQQVDVYVQGAEPSCSLSVYPILVLLEYGKTVTVKCSANSTNTKVNWRFANSTIDNDTLLINSTSLNDFLDGNLKATCYGEFDLCHQDVVVIIYRIPEKVSISILDHAGPMIEGNNYTLRCDIQNAAIVHLLIVNWYKGKNLIASEHFSSGSKYLTNKTATLTITPNRNDNITSYICETELKLPLKSHIKVKSNPFNIIVYYKPAIHKKSPQWVPVFHGYSEVLVCKASGYPEPTITWIYNDKIFQGENLTVKENDGEYTCIASNSVGNDTRVVNVVLKEDYLPLIAGLVALVVVIISVFFISIYSIYYKNTKMGHYTVEGATPIAQNCNVAQSGKDNTIPMKKILV